MMGPSRKAVLVGVVFGLIATLTLLSASARRGAMNRVPIGESLADDDLPRLYPLVDFSLTDSTGQPFSRSDMKGKVWVADFIFTSCSGPCPVMSSRMAELYRALADEPDLNFLSVSVNPEVDSPEVLAAYGKKLGADPSRWRFLTGDIGEIQRLAVEGFKLGSVDDPIIHSERFALVDRHGFVRGYYEGTTQEGLVRLTRDLARLLK